MTIIPLSEGSFTIDQTKVFVPFDKDTDDLQQRPTGSLLVEIQPFLLITDSEKILLDTGLGFTDKLGNMQLYENLRKHGVDPGDITKVLLSHLHRDHSGGIIHKGDTHQPDSLSFPNAIYYVHAQELSHATEKLSRSYDTSTFYLLNHTTNISLLGNEGFIDANIRYSMSGAHSPYHTVFWISDNGQTIFFGGDVAPQLQQMKNRFVAKYDYDGKKSMELRQQWWEQGKQEHWTFLFYHDIKSPSIGL